MRYPAQKPMKKNLLGGGGRSLTHHCTVLQTCRDHRYTAKQRYLDVVRPCLFVNIWTLVQTVNTGRTTDVRFSPLFWFQGLLARWGRPDPLLTHHIPQTVIPDSHFRHLLYLRFRHLRSPMLLGYYIPDRAFPPPPLTHTLTDNHVTRSHVSGCYEGAPCRYVFIGLCYYLRQILSFSFWYSIGKNSFRSMDQNVF